MITFLPLADFKESAKCLDHWRLRSQCFETVGILNSLIRKEGRWYNTVMIKMWEGYEGKLVEYGLFCAEEWTNRGNKDYVTDDLIELHQKGKYTFEKPPWLGDDRVHSSHRQVLLARKPAHYNQFGWIEKPLDKYFWPVKVERVKKEDPQLQLI